MKRLLKKEVSLDTYTWQKKYAHLTSNLVIPAVDEKFKRRFSISASMEEISKLPQNQETKKVCIQWVLTLGPPIQTFHRITGSSHKTSFSCSISTLWSAGGSVEWEISAKEAFAAGECLSFIIFMFNFDSFHSEMFFKKMCWYTYKSLRSTHFFFLRKAKIIFFYF